MKQLLLLAGLFGAAPAAAQVTQDGALYTFIGSPDNFHLSGSVRLRTEALDGQFRPDRARADQLLSLRTTLFAEYDTGPIRIGAEFYDARGYVQNDDSSADTGVVNTLEFAQYYMGVDLDDALGEGSETRVTVGRMTMTLGSSRLVSRQAFRNSTNAYTGLRLERTAAGGRRFVAFWTMPNVRMPSDAASILDNRAQWDRETSDLQLFGMFNAVPVGDVLSLETYAYGLVERDAPGFDTTNRHLFTPGFRLKRKPAQGLDFEVEAMAQYGTVRASRSAADTLDRSVQAYGIHGELGHGWAGRRKPRVAAFFDYYTGNRRGDHNRFDTLYGGRRFEFGPSGLFGPVSRSNLVSPGIRIESKPTTRLDLMGNVRLLRLDSATDSFGTTNVRDAEGRSGHDAGEQFEAQLRYKLVPDIALLDVGYAYVRKGPFLRNAPNAPATGNTSYAYASMTFTF